MHKSHVCVNGILGNKSGLCCLSMDGGVKAIVHPPYNYHWANACQVSPLERKYGERCTTCHACINRLFGHNSGLRFLNTNAIMKATVHQTYNYHGAIACQVWPSKSKYGVRYTTCRARVNGLFGHKSGFSFYSMNGTMKATVHQACNYHGANACQVWPLESKYGVRCTTWRAGVNGLFEHKSGFCF